MSEAAPRRRRSVGFRSRAGLLLVLLAGLLGGGELVARALGLVDVNAGVATEAQAIFYASHMFESSDEPGLGYRNRPQASVEAAGIEYRHDARGHRVLPDGPATTEAPGVAFLGDSTTYGWGVAAADCLPARTAARCPRPLRALNLGVIGYGTGQEVALYESERALLGDDVRIVVLVFYPNDTVEHAFRWDDSHGALYVDELPLPDALKPTLWTSALYRGLVSWHTERLRASGALEVGSPAGRATSFASLERLARLVADDGRILLVAHLPGMVALDPYEFAGLVEMLRAHCEALGVPFVDLLPAFDARRESEISAYEARTGEIVTAEQRRHYLARFWVDPAGRDQHLNGEANAVAASALAETLAALLASDGRR